MPDIPLGTRIAAFVVLMAVVAGFDAWRNRGQATRWREYGFLLIAAGVGGGFGVVTDQITATISPYYFILGKDIEPGDGFRLRVASLGFHAGFGAGAFIGGLYLLANNPRPDRFRLPYRQLARHIATPAAASLLMVPVSMVVLAHLDPLELTIRLRGYLDDPGIAAFRRVWSIHVGLYAGAAAGTVWALRAIRRERRCVAGRDATNPGGAADRENDIH